MARRGVPIGPLLLTIDFPADSFKRGHVVEFIPNYVFSSGNRENCYFNQISDYSDLKKVVENEFNHKDWLKVLPVYISACL